MIFDLTPDQVADVVEEEISLDPSLDVRLTGADRFALRADPSMGAFLCYVAPTQPVETRAPAPQRAITHRRRQPMLVRDGMNPIVVSVDPATRSGRPLGG